MPLMLEVEENENCERLPQLIFNTLEEGRPVTHVRTIAPGGETAFHRVTGWCSSGEGSPCPAYAVKIEESGLGEAVLVYGGDWGIRLMSAAVDEPWDLGSPNQWGEGLLSVDDGSQVKLADGA